MDSDERAEYYTQLEGARAKFYEKNRKNLIFKNKQKLECAQTVTEEFDLNKMIACTAFIVPNTNIIYYNYLVFKIYGHESNQREVYTHFRGLICSLLEKYETFEVHVNLKTFTVSACQRYYKMITSSFDDNTMLTDKMSKLVIYHTPSIVDQLTAILYSTIRTILPKTEYYYKDSSEARINTLFDIVNK